MRSGLVPIIVRSTVGMNRPPSQKNLVFRETLLPARKKRRTSTKRIGQTDLRGIYNHSPASSMRLLLCVQQGLLFSGSTPCCWSLLPWSLATLRLGVIIRDRMPSLDRSVEGLASLGTYRETDYLQPSGDFSFGAKR